MTTELNNGRNDAMPHDKRLNLDAEQDLNALRNNLLKDVEEATKQAQQRKAQDAARDAKDKTATQSKMIMIAIIAVAVIAIGLIAWKVTSSGGKQSGDWKPGQYVPMQPKVNTVPRGTVPVQPQRGAMPVAPGRAYAPTAPMGMRPAQPAQRGPASEPVRRNGSDTYDEGRGSRM